MKIFRRIIRQITLKELSANFEKKLGKFGKLWEILGEIFKKFQKILENSKIFNFEEIYWKSFKLNNQF